jgi:hypothetical protein
MKAAKALWTSAEWLRFNSDGSTVRGGSAAGWRFRQKISITGGMRMKKMLLLGAALAALAFSAPAHGGVKF